MIRAWRNELGWALVPAAAGIAVGFAFGVPGWGLAAGLCGALLWRLGSFIRLARRLHTHAQGRELAGVAGELEATFHRHLRRERDLRSELTRLRREIVESTQAMPDGAVVLDADGTIQWANASACRAFGLKVPGDLGRPLVQLLRDPLLVERLAHRGEAAEVEIVSPVAPQMELLVHVAPYGEGRTLVLARDVTRLKRLERMRRDFVANVSHELRSPLTVVAGYLEMLSEDPQAPEKWRTPLGETRRQVSRMVAIVRDLLELARLESEAAAPPRTPVEMRALLERVRSQALAAGDAGGRREIRLDIQTNAEVLGSETELESAVGNLVSNAVKYSGEDGHIVVAWRLVGRQARLSVSDDGIGIPERDIPRLTERFYRVDKGRSARSGGTGLGLAIVKHIAERHGARLYIESRYGQGSTFTLAFPNARVHRFDQQASVAG